MNRAYLSHNPSVEGLSRTLHALRAESVGDLAILTRATLATTLRSYHFAGYYPNPAGLIGNRYREVVACRLASC